MLSLATLRELSRLALPMVVSQGAFALMMFSDRYFLSRIDTVHVAGAQGGGVTFWVCLCFFSGLLAYGNALVAQAYGGRRFSECPLVLTQGVLLSLLFTPLVLLVAWSLRDVFHWLGHEPSLAKLESDYFQVLVLGTLPFLVKAAFASYFSGIGRTRVVMICDVAGVALNIPLTYALIFGKAGLPALGIAGAGLASVVAALLSIAAYLLFYLERIHRQFFEVGGSISIKPALLRRYVRFGMPAGIEMLVAMGTFNIFLLLFQSYGVTAGAAMAIVFTWDMVSFVPMMGLSIAVTSLVGRGIGAGDLSKTQAVIGAGFAIGLGYSGLLALLFLSARVPLIELFAAPGADFSEVVRVGSPMMVGMCTYILADAVLLVCSGTLRGAGDTRWLMITSVTVHLAMLAIQVVIIKMLALPPLVSWWIFVASLCLNALLYLHRTLGGRWRAPERLAGVLAP